MSLPQGDFGEWQPAEGVDRNKIAVTVCLIA